MFPGRFPNVPDTMWNFGWNPQTMGLQGQFCGGDMMNQSSQAQSQAQTQAQIAALREQNAILNQQLTSQAQSHIQHLQQLIPFHQPCSTGASHIHSTASTTIRASSARSTNTSGTSNHSSWTQSILQSWRDDAADEAHSWIQHSSLRGQNSRAQYQPTSCTSTPTHSNISTEHQLLSSPGRLLEIQSPNPTKIPVPWPSIHVKETWQTASLHS